MPTRVFRRILFLALLSCCSWATAAEDWQVAFADRVLAARQAGEPMPQLSVAHPAATLEEAYQIQGLLVSRLLGKARPRAFKAAIVAEAGRKAMALENPLVAVLPPNALRPATPPQVVDLSTDPARHLETEIGYILRQTLKETVEDIATLKKSVAAIAAIIEVPGSPVEAAQPATATDLLAWNINAKEIILATPLAGTELDVDALEITLTRDGEVINTGNGGQAAGGQWQTLLETVNELVRLGYTLQPGDIITNGALGKVVKAEPGAYEADFGPLGKITFSVVAGKAE